jgi:hypothetical protein
LRERYLKRIWPNIHSKFATYGITEEEGTTFPPFVQEIESKKRTPRSQSTKRYTRNEENAMVLEIVTSSLDNPDTRAFWDKVAKKKVGPAHLFLGGLLSKYGTK